MSVQAMKVGTSIIYVEVDEQVDIELKSVSPHPNNLELVGKETEWLEDKFELLKNQIRELTNGVNDALKSNRPDQVELEMSFSFGGKANWMPFLVSSKADVALKVKTTWKKPSVS